MHHFPTIELVFNVMKRRMHFDYCTTLVKFINIISAVFYTVVIVFPILFKTIGLWLLFLILFFFPIIHEGQNIFVHVTHESDRRF